MGVSFSIDGEAELDPAADWTAQKMAYGQKVAMAIADGVVPQLAAQFGGERSSPANSHLTGSNSLDNVSGTNKVGDHVLSVREKVAGTFRFQGDSEMSVGDIVFAARDSIAGAVTDLVLFALEQRLEGKQANHTKWRIRRKDGEITDFSRTDVPQDKTGKAPAAASPQLD